MFDQDTELHPATRRAVRFRKICVYCGSAPGTDPRFVEAAQAFGAQMAAHGIGLVYGGGGRGMMGATARAVLDNGGVVTGIIPDFLTDHDAVLVAAQELHVVPDMHTRKRMMFEESDAFVALPGGVGTLEELVEQLTWLQLERHTKPVLIADIGGFWRPLLALFEHMREKGFIQQTLEVRYLVAERVEDILPMLTAAAERNAALGHRKETVDRRL